MVENELVTVIVPVYKVEEYLPGCIESIQAQTHRRLQILLVDDGSPDRCGSICEQYAQEDARIQVIHQQNGGVSAARNAGLAAAKGDYICFVDGDDRAAADMVRHALAALQAGPYDLCAFGAQVWENGACSYSGRRKEMRVRFQSQKLKMRFLCRWFFTGRTGWGVCRRIFRREIIERGGLRFGDAIFAEDMDFTFRYLLHCESFYLLPEPLSIYLVRSTSAMRTIVRQKQAEQFLSVLQRQKADFTGLPVYLFEAVALSCFMGEPEEGEPLQQRACQLLGFLKNCPEWEALQEDARLALREKAFLRRACGWPYGSLAGAFCQFLLDGDEVRYLKNARIYYGYWRLKRWRQRLLFYKGGQASAG